MVVMTTTVMIVMMMFVSSRMRVVVFFEGNCKAKHSVLGFPSVLGTAPRARLTSTLQLDQERESLQLVEQNKSGPAPFTMAKIGNMSFHTALLGHAGHLLFHRQKTAPDRFLELSTLATCSGKLRKDIEPLLGRQQLQAYLRPSQSLLWQRWGRRAPLPL